MTAASAVPSRAQRRRVGVLLSGRGSNMRTLHAATLSADFPAEIVCIVSNKADAGGLAYAAEQGIPAVAIDHRAFSDRESFDRALDAALREHGVDLVALAGFMRIFSPWFPGAWDGRMINIHPSLLPNYKGLHTHARALADGVRIAGCTVHFVTAELDAGPIIAQAAVPVTPDDTPDSLSARVLTAEHVLYPHALRLVASGAARLVGGRVEVEATDHDAAAPPLVVPPLRDSVRA
ncbi:phosphoribosylglycinamide formyltransferase [Chthonobacter rhizosphaerae]|uniref:phosphoribosylglycinamide formyltransferase n=1 Tax=Chthonobacter rhizosphaerae TaxID=2735553 RepID=UPI0015EE443A|nr:phosphoribosylglycinamide formyltransferase [Chthonobacter rhizosphaerae]